jgi:aminoglycoside phosphotransferase (APT) family kinase protein
MAYIKKLDGIIDTKAALSLWEKALSFTWSKNPVWIHGDFASGNILVKDNSLSAVIDFGGMSIGDPACDLVIAWTFLKNESRKIFKKHVNLDKDTWTRARAWGLWKAMFELCSIQDKSTIEALKQKTIINDILNENHPHCSAR